MAVYEYEVVTEKGSIETGQVDAETKEAAIQKLRASGFLVVEIKEREIRRFSGLLKRKGKVKLGDLSIFSRQLATMLNAGIPVTRALYVLTQQTSNYTFRMVLEDVTGNVEAGMSLTEALNNHKNIFSNLYISMVNAGEVGGTLEGTLGRLSEQLQKEKTLQDNIRSASIYPGMIVIFATIVLLAMLIFLVPVFINIFPSEMKLPLPTQIVISFSESLRSYWYVWFGTGLVLVYLINRFYRSSVGKNFWENIKFKIPIFGQLFYKAVIARFARNLSTLLAGGIPVIQALEAAGPTSGSMMVARAVNKATEKIQEGETIAGSLEESDLFPPMMIQMVSVGEETGALSTLLTKIAEFYEDEVTVLTNGLTAILEPVLLIIVGIMVGAMVIALYLPIFTAVIQL